MLLLKQPSDSREVRASVSQGRDLGFDPRRRQTTKTFHLWGTGIPCNPSYREQARKNLKRHLLQYTDAGSSLQ